MKSKIVWVLTITKMYKIENYHKRENDIRTRNQEIDRHVIKLRCKLMNRHET